MPLTPLRALLGELASRLGGDVGVLFRVVLGQDGIGRAVGLVSVGDPDLTTTLRPFEGVPLGHWGFGLAALPTTNRWVARQPEEVSAFVRDLVWTPFGFASQLGCQVAAQGHVWGWVGVLRRGGAAYAETDGRRFPIRELLARVQATEEAETPGPVNPVRLVLQGTEVLFSEPGADEALAVPGRRDVLLTLGPPERGARRFGWAHGAVFEAVALSGPAGAAAWLVTLLPARRFEASVLLLLSPTERRVAELAAEGATVAEIASALGRSQNTVKTHLRRVYEAAGVASRAELLDLVRDAVPRGARDLPGDWG